MDRAVDVALAKRFFALLDTHAYEPAPAVQRWPAAVYTDAAHLEREREVLFRQRPLLAGLTADIPAAGDYLSFDAAGLPLVVVRGDDGVARAFVNSCRHRSARVVEQA